MYLCETRDDFGREVDRGERDQSSASCSCVQQPGLFLMARVGPPIEDQSAVIWFKGKNQKSRNWLFSCLLFCFLLRDICGLQESPPTQLSALGATFGYSSPPSIAGTGHLSEDTSEESGEDTSSNGKDIRGTSLIRGLLRRPPDEHKVPQVQQPIAHGHPLMSRTKPELRKRRYATTFGRRTKRDRRRHRKRTPERIRYKGNFQKNLPRGSSQRKRKARNQDAPSGRIQIADSGSYISPSFERNGQGVSSFRHYKDFQNDLNYPEIDDKTSSSSAPSSSSLLLSSSSSSDNSEKLPNLSQFPDTIVKDGQIFYRHDGTEDILATIGPPSTTTSPNGDRSHYSPTQGASEDTSESKVPRGFNVLMDHVRQVGAGAPIISAAIAGASVRGSSTGGSSSHVIGSAINGGYFAASAQGYDGKGGAIHSHVRGTSEGVSGGASAIAPDRDGEAFIQVDHSERGLSIGQSSTQNGEAFVIADIDSESKRMLKHGDSTSSYSNTYQTKHFGHTLGEAKSNISPIDPRTGGGWRENSFDSIDNEDHKQQKQRSVGIDMINNIIEKVHLPNAGLLPSSGTLPDLRPEENLWNLDASLSHQENHSGFQTPSEERLKGREFLTGIDEEYHSETRGHSTKAKKKGTVGVVTFPYDHEGLPPGPGELLDQSLPTNLPSLPSFSKIPALPRHATLNHNAIMEDSGTTEEKYNNINRLPLFSSDVLRGNNYSINSFDPHHYDFTNRNNFIEYQHPQVEKRLSSNDTTDKTTNINGHNHSHFTDSNDLDYQKSLKIDNTPEDPRNTEKVISEDYFDHSLHDFNLTHMSRESGQFDDYLYNNSYLNHRRISLENDTIEEDNPNHLYSHTYDNNQNFLDHSYDDVRPFDLPVVPTPDFENSRRKTDLNQEIEQDYDRDSLDYWTQNRVTNKQPYYPSPSDHIPYYPDIYDDQLTTRPPVDYELYNSFEGKEVEAGRTSSRRGDERENVVGDLHPTTFSPDLDFTTKPLSDFLDLSEDREIIAEDKLHSLGTYYPSTSDQIPYHYLDVYDAQLTTKIPVDYDVYNLFDDKDLATGRAYPPPRNEAGKVDFGSYPTTVSPRLDFTTKHLTDYYDLSDNTIRNITPAHTTSRIDWVPVRGHDTTVKLTTTPRSESLPDHIGRENEVHRHETHVTVSTEASHPNYWRDQTTEKWPHLPFETDASFRGPTSTRNSKHTKIIQAGRAGSSHLLEPPSPGYPHIRIVSLDHSTPRHPQHKEGIMLGPEESIPGLPGYRMPPGFRGKIIFGNIVSRTGNSRQRSYDRNFPSFHDRQPFSRPRDDYIQRKTSSYRYQSKPRDFKILRYARNNYSRKPGSSNPSRIICKDLPECDPRHGSRNKDELCDFSSNGVVCCC